jgi:Nif-specific regulatory protein
MGSSHVAMHAKLDRFRLLYDLGCAFAARIELDELLPLIMGKCREVLDADGAAILLHDEAADELYFPYVAEAATEVESKLSQMRFPAGRGIAGCVLRSGTCIRVDDVANDSRFYPVVDRSTTFTTRNMLAAPLKRRGGTIGVIQVVNRREGMFTDDDLVFLESLSGVIAIAIENAQLYARIKESEGRLRTQVGALRRDLARREGFPEVLGASEAMAEVFRLMESASSSPISVLIEGETGTGKELVAQAIHRASERAEGPFLAINCAALSETLLESELFGHRRGAFTGAVDDRRGLFEAASGGTIFLDEVGEMPLAMQAKLLRVLQEGEVVPVGDTRPRKVDVRVISATNRELAGEVAQQHFREDLYYRLSAFPIRLPPLRQRREDIPLLVERILANAAERHRKSIPGIDADAMRQLVGRDWPGNVRQLQNEIERAVALARNGESLEVRHLSLKFPPAAPSEEEPLRPGVSSPEVHSMDLREARAEFEARFIAEALRKHGGNVSHTAAHLGLSRVMLQRKMKEYGLRE